MSYVRPNRPRTPVVRRARVKPQAVEVREQRRLPEPVRAPLLFALIFLGLIAAGSLLLSLPWANNEGTFTPYITALFTATSAVCVAGLVVVDTGTYWSPVGQAIILLLMQVGGLGIMTSSTFLWLLVGRRVTLRERMLLSEAQGGSAVGGVVGLTISVLRISLLFEIAGALVLTVRFALDHELGQAVWMGLFHAVSAFNNAGFDIMGGFRSLTGYREDPLVILCFAALLIAGSVSYVTIVDLFTRGRFHRLLLETKMVLTATAGLLIAGTLLFLVFEWDNPDTLGPMSLPFKVLNAFFSAASLRTAGFVSIGVSELTQASLLLAIALMFIGGATGSTAGGIKVNTFAVMTATVISTLRGRTVTSAFGREIAQDQVYRSFTIVLLAIGWIFGAALLLFITEPFEPIQSIFEATSAFATMGASTGITPELTLPAKVLIIVTIYVGRLGPLTAALALVERSVRAERYKYPQGEIRVG